MKKIAFILLISTVSVIGCKSKRTAATSAAPANSTSAAMITSNQGNTTGKVSHEYRATGCNTVINFEQEGVRMTIIPKDPLPSELDIDGTQITFNYRTLRMPNPEGCTVGIPAEVSDISKK